MPDNTGPTQHSLPMFEPSEPTNSAKPTLSSAGSHVKISASPGKALALLVNDLVYGTSSDGLLARFDPDSCSWRTFQLSLFGEEPKSLDILPRWGMTRGGELWQRPTPERPTAGSVGGAWVTATASDWKRGATSPQAASDWKRGAISPQAFDKRHSPTLPELLTAGKWSTPTASDHQRGHRSGRFRRSTPTVMEANPNGGVLNPEWVEMLMGYPPGYTDIETEQED